MEAHEKFQEWIDGGGRKQKWVAEQLFVDRGTLWTWLRGTRVPQKVHRRSIAELTDDAVPADIWPEVPE